jgi:amino acid transporter
LIKQTLSFQVLEAMVVSALLAMVCWSFVASVVARGGASPSGRGGRRVDLPLYAKIILVVVGLFVLWFIGRLILRAIYRTEDSPPALPVATSEVQLEKRRKAFPFRLSEDA